MKKFFETPAVSSAELTREDVMMNSTIASTNGAFISVKFEDEQISDQFNMWKGYDAE